MDQAPPLKCAHIAAPPFAAPHRSSDHMLLGLDDILRRGVQTQRRTPAARLLRCRLVQSVLHQTQAEALQQPRLHIDHPACTRILSVRLVLRGHVQLMLFYSSSQRSSWTAFLQIDIGRKVGRRWWLR